MSNLLAIKEYEIHYYEVGFNKKAHITTIINIFQDIFVYQSEITGIGLDYLSDNSLTWIVSKWDIQIFKYPIYREKIKVKMCPISLKKFYMYIKYVLLDENENVIAEAISSWILIDTKRRKPYKITEELSTLYGLSLTDGTSISIDKINLVEKIDLEKAFHVGYSDIDTNGHVNNAKYISWALDIIPEDIIREYKLTRIKINYKKETNYNEIILSGIEIIKDKNGHLIKCLHKIYTRDNIVLTVLESIWEANNY